MIRELLKSQAPSDVSKLPLRWPSPEKDERQAGYLDQAGERIRVGKEVPGGCEPATFLRELAEEARMPDGAATYLAAPAATLLPPCCWMLVPEALR